MIGRVVISAAVVVVLALGPRLATAREFRHRTVTIGDTSEESIPVLQVEPGVATVIAFQANIRDATFVRPVGSLFQKLTRTDRTVVVVPKQVVAKPSTLNVMMADGTVLTFALVTAPKYVDAQVDVVIALKAAPDSPEALKTQVAEVRARLEECKGASGKEAAKKIAALILEHGANAPQAFETHAIRGSERQSRLRLDAQRIYRLLGFTYVVLLLENRDPQRNWVLARPVVHLTGGNQNVELTLEAQATDVEEVPPDKEQRVVVVFKTPQSVGPDQRFSIELLEKDGTRRVELKNLEL